MNFLIIGGSGFLGSHVADLASENGHKVKIFDKNPSKYLQKNQQMIVGDIKKINEYKNIFKNIDIVFNFAGIADINKTKKNPEDTVYENILPLIDILKLCKNFKIKKLVFASTIYVYSQQGYYYRCSKVAAEIYLKEFCKINKLRYGILRYGSLYGPRSNETNGLYKIVSQILKNKSIKYYGTSKSRREYIHVKDAARASLELIDKKFDNQSVLVTGESSFSIEDIIKIISEIIDKKVRVNYLNKKDKSTGHYQYTPYSYSIEESKKYTLPFHVDIGQGIIDIVRQIKK